MYSSNAHLKPPRIHSSTTTVARPRVQVEQAQVQVQVLEQVLVLELVPELEQVQVQVPVQVTTTTTATTMAAKVATRPLLPPALLLPLPLATYVFFRAHEFIQSINQCAI